MNYKRDAIEEFIKKDLVEAVTSEMAKDVLAEQSKAMEELKQVRGEVHQNFGDKAMDAEGNLEDQYKSTPLGKRYLELHNRAHGVVDRTALEALVFNHLYTFFSRYYDNGDFMSKRRYSRQQKYAIPYNGEEVYLHWANQDQYYIKTEEYFRNYSFTAHGYTVHFKMQDADVEQNNAKGDKRFFIVDYSGVTVDDKASEIIIPFEHRPLTAQEEISYGKKTQQDAIISDALKEIPKRLKGSKKASLVLTAERRKASNGGSMTYLEHHLRQYTR
jgi:adenine-specific DNA-methyltransferase